MNPQTNSLRILTFAVVLAVFSAISALSFIPACSIIKQLAKDSSIHHTIPTESDLESENQTIKKEFCEEEDEILGDNNRIDSKFTCVVNIPLELSLMVPSDSRDIQSPPPKIG